MPYTIRMSESKITVIKRDNTIEPLDEGKIVRVAKATGLTEEEAKVVSDAIYARILKSVDTDTQEIKSTTIRDYFLEELQKTNKYAAGLYEWYEKSKTN